MASPAHEHDHGHADPVTERMHDHPLSANLETPAHADDRELVIEQAIDTIRHTERDNHVNLVTHGDHGHPAEYLYPELELISIDRAFEFEYIDQCGCEGHVTRVHVH